MLGMGSQELSSGAITRIGMLFLTIAHFSLDCHLQFIPDIV